MGTYADRIRDAYNTIAGNVRLANAKTGKDDTGITDAVQSLIAMADGGGKAVSGTFTVDADYPIYNNAPFVVPVSPGFMPDYFCLWMSRDTFLSLPSVSNNIFYRLGYTKLDDSVPPIHYTANQAANDVAQKDGRWIFYTIVVSNATGTASPNGYGLGATQWFNATQYGAPWGIDADGVLTIGRASSAMQTVKAGIYNWIAIKGISGYIM